MRVRDPKEKLTVFTWCAASEARSHNPSPHSEAGCCEHLRFAGPLPPRQGLGLAPLHSLHYEPPAPLCLEQGTHFSRQRHPNERAHIGIDLEKRCKHPMQTLLGNQHVVQDKVVHAGRKKAVYGVLGRFHDGLTLDVERGVEEHGHPGNSVESLEQMIQTFVVLTANRFYARRAIDMHDGRNLISPCGTHVLCEQHEWRFRLAFEDFVGLLGKHYRRKRPESLPVLHPAIELVFHFGFARIGENTTIAQRTGSEFGAALEPTENVASASNLAVSAQMFA